MQPCSILACDFTGTTKTGSDAGSITLTRDPTRPGQNRWPGDPWPEDSVLTLPLMASGYLGRRVVKPLDSPLIPVLVCSNKSN